MTVATRLIGSSHQVTVSYLQKKKNKSHNRHSMYMKRHKISRIIKQFGYSPYFATLTIIPYTFKSI